MFAAFPLKFSKVSKFRRGICSMMHFLCDEPGNRAALSRISTAQPHIFCFMEMHSHRMHMVSSRNVVNSCEGTVSIVRVHVLTVVFPVEFYFFTNDWDSLKRNKISSVVFDRVCFAFVLSDRSNALSIFNSRSGTGVKGHNSFA